MKPTNGEFADFARFIALMFACGGVGACIGFVFALWAVKP